MIIAIYYYHYYCCYYYYYLNWDMRGKVFMSKPMRSYMYFHFKQHPLEEKYKQRGRGEGDKHLHVCWIPLAKASWLYSGCGLQPSMDSAAFGAYDHTVRHVCPLWISDKKRKQKISGMIILHLESSFFIYDSLLCAAIGTCHVGSELEDFIEGGLWASVRSSFLLLLRLLMIHLITNLYTHSKKIN